jgi:predicted Rossmann fold nucleotide-binding protein DprA/Smf involved in DNA uptake
LLNERLVLVSPFNPEAGFDVGNAMARNRYIYCLADAAVVVATSNGSGGTWNGAVQNLKEQWVPLWVKRNTDPRSGASALIEQGAHWVPEGEFRVSELLSPTTTVVTDQHGAAVDAVPPDSMSPLACAPAEPAQIPADLDFYTLFLHRILTVVSAAPASPDQLCSALDLHKSQLDVWLSRAVADGRLRKLTKPVRYTAAAQASPQPQLFS